MTASTARGQAQWARLREDFKCPLRRGAWYRVAKVKGGEAIVEIGHRSVHVPISVLELAAETPQHWAVVPRPENARQIPASWGERYGVCPNCRHRVPLAGQPASLRCPRCNGLFDVAWTA